MRPRVLLLSLLLAVRVFAAEPWDSTALRTPYRDDLPLDEKLAGVAALWAEVRFNFANFDLVPQLDWDAQLPLYIAKARATTSTRDYYKVLTEMMALLHDGHSDAAAPNELTDELYARPLLRTRYVDGHVLVYDVFSDELKANGIAPGLEVVAIDGIPVHEYAEKRVMPYVAASTPQDRDNRSFGNELLFGSVKDAVRLTLSDAKGKQFDRTVPRVTAKEYAAARPKLPLTEFRLLPGNVGYIAINSFNDPNVVKEFDAAWDKIAATKALVIDVRENGGGNSREAWDILSRLTDKPFHSSAWRTREYRPSYRAWRSDELPKWHLDPGSEKQPNGTKFYGKPVVLLTSPRTFSAAEDFSVTFDAMDRGKIIGEPTGGSTGQPLFFRLPGGGGARVCTKRDTYPDGKEFVGIGVQPDIPAKPTMADVRAGRDVVLERALATLR